jgi:hypothetical protein
MAKPTIMLVCSALMLAIAKDDGQRMLAFAFVALSLVMLFVVKTGEGANTLAQLESRKWLLRVLWLSLLPLTWWLLQEGPSL